MRSIFFYFQNIRLSIMFATRGVMAVWSKPVLNAWLVASTRTMSRDTRNVVDLRSDVLSTQSEEVKQAMRDAVVGDDVFQEDPTVKELENFMAKQYGTESAIFAASGCMVMTHCERRDSEIILGDLQHIQLYEQNSYARIVGASVTQVPNQQDGTIDLNALENAVRIDDVHCPRSTLICLENTHNMCSGSVLPETFHREVNKIAKRHSLKVHLDGARLMHASVASGKPMSDFVQHCDSVMMCMSKIGAPLGSVVGGSDEFIQKARRNRKLIGGGWRQPGYMAAAALKQLETAKDRLAEDHENAKRLVDGIKALKSSKLSIDHYPGSNLVFMKTTSNAADVSAMLRDPAHGTVVLGFPLTKDSVRFVVYADITSSQIDQVINKLQTIEPKL